MFVKMLQIIWFFLDLRLLINRLLFSPIGQSLRNFQIQFSDFIQFLFAELSSLLGLLLRQCFFPNPRRIILSYQFTKLSTLLSISLDCFLIGQLLFLLSFVLIFDQLPYMQGALGRDPSMCFFSDFKTAIKFIFVFNFLIPPLMLIELLGLDGFQIFLDNLKFPLSILNFREQNFLFELFLQNLVEKGPFETLFHFLVGLMNDSIPLLSPFLHLPQALLDHHLPLLFFSFLQLLSLGSLLFLDLLLILALHFKSLLLALQLPLSLLVEFSHIQKRLFADLLLALNFNQLLLLLKLVQMLLNFLNLFEQLVFGRLKDSFLFSLFLFRKIKCYSALDQAQLTCVRGTLKKQTLQVLQISFFHIIVTILYNQIMSTFQIPLGFTIAHGTILSYGWIIFSTVGILFFMCCPSKPWARKAHPILMGTLFVISFCFMVSMLVMNLVVLGEGTYENSLQQAHNIIGYVLLGQMTLLVIGGIVSNYLVQNTLLHSKHLALFKWTHRVLGFQVWFLFGIEAIIGWIGNLALLPVASCATVFFLTCAILMTVSIYNIFLREHKLSIQQTGFIECRQQISGVYLIFNDYVFLLNRNSQGKIQSFHPGGRLIIQAVLNRQVDRFVYGMYGVQTLQNSDPHLHDFDCTDILGRPPLGKLIQPILLTNYRDWWVYKNIQLAPDTCLYMFNNRMSKFTNVIENPDQLGKYYVIQAVGLKRVRRLYTQVICMTDINRTHTSQLLAYFNKNVINNENLVEIQPCPKQTNFLPLVIKRYDTGKFTSYLFNNRSQNCFYNIEGPKGRGLRLYGPGNYMIVGGGTGILPFLDLLHMLFVKGLYQVALKRGDLQIAQFDLQEKRQTATTSK